MIEKHQNTILNRSLGRIVTYDSGWSQITINDQRFYKKNNVFYPSVSFILSYYPKGKNFESFLKSKGEEADIIAHEAASKGTNVHNAIEQMLTGTEPKWINDDGYVNYSLDEWMMILRFAEFWNTHKPKLIQSEYHIFSDEHKFAGTIDLVLEINGELWLLDIKTSNNLHTTYELQLAAYSVAWNEHNPDNKIKKTGVLWLKAATRKPDSRGEKLQGSGWQIKTFERNYEDSFKIFQNVYNIFRVEIPEPKPATDIYPNSIKLALE
jgi:hypothetical protein